MDKSVLGLKNLDYFDVFYDYFLRAEPIIKIVTSKEELEPVKLKFCFKLIFFKKCISYHFIKECEQEFYMTVLLSRQKILQG